MKTLSSTMYDASMKKNICYICLICVCLWFMVDVSYAATSNITKVVFTTLVRGADINTLSDAITIQTQNASGEEEKLDSTADVIFTSSSATGEFLGSTGKAVTKTMNSGSANKTFYYRDSVEGIHTITIEVVPRNGEGGWIVSQNIYVGVPVPESLSDNDADEDHGSNSSSKSNVSSHSSTRTVSTYKKQPAFKMSAGRDRVVMVNTPIYFEAETNTGDPIRDQSVDFLWSYGDGDGDYGRRVKHTYYFPGEYKVVLSARKGKDEWVSIISVTVLGNDLVISDVVHGSNGYVEVENKASYEANINGWWIANDERSYLISGDTIIASKSKLKIPNKVLRFEPSDSVRLLFPAKETAYTYDPALYIAQVSTSSMSHAPLSNHTEAALIDSPAEEVSSEEEIKINYATTVHAVPVADRSGWWSYLKSFFSIE